MDIREARAYLAEERLDEPTLYEQFGYFDFDNPTENGRPTIVGKFYGSNTRAGLMLSGTWEKVLRRSRRPVA